MWKEVKRCGGRGLTERADLHWAGVANRFPMCSRWSTLAPWFYKVLDVFELEIFSSCDSHRFPMCLGHKPKPFSAVLGMNTDVAVVQTTAKMKWSFCSLNSALGMLLHVKYVGMLVLLHVPVGALMLMCLKTLYSLLLLMCCRHQCL
jgi:hypothetical protein